MTCFRRFTFSITFLLFTLQSIAQTRYVDALFDSVDMQTFNYSKVNDSILKLDVYNPVHNTLTKRPLILIVHGGGFNTGKRNDPSIVSMAKRIAQKGFVVASIDYRLLKAKEDLECEVSKNFKLITFAKAAEDITEALLYLLKYNEDFKIDDTKIILLGSSAGAETILNLTYNRDLVINSNYIHQTPKIAAIISISGAILDTSLMTASNAVPGIFNHGTPDPVVPYGSGSHHSCSKFENCYLPEYGSKAIVDKLEQLNSSFLFYSYLNRKHDIFNLPNEDFYQAFLFIKRVVIDNEFYQAKIVE